MDTGPFSRLLASAKPSNMETFTPAPTGFARCIVKKAFANAPASLETPEWSRSLVWGLTAAVSLMLVCIFWNHKALTLPLSTESTVERHLAELIFQP